MNFPTIFESALWVCARIRYDKEEIGLWAGGTKLNNLYVKFSSAVFAQHLCSYRRAQHNGIWITQLYLVAHKLWMSYICYVFICMSFDFVIFHCTHFNMENAPSLCGILPTERAKNKSCNWIMKVTKHLWGKAGCSVNHWAR